MLDESSPFGKWLENSEPKIMYEPGDLDPVSQRVKPTTHI